jgi:hypothetical protein
MPIPWRGYACTTPSRAGHWEHMQACVPMTRTTPAPTSWYRPWLGLGPSPRSTGLSGQWSEDGPHLRLGPQRMALACGQEPSALAGMPVTLRGPPARV